MKIIHTADLHLGQIIYQNYDRVDEHRHFFDQLTRWCIEEQPDALIVSGDLFDIQQPSATVKKAFTDYFVNIHRQCPSMRIVLTAGNHDSASRIQAEQQLWLLANTTAIGLPPASDCLDNSDNWQDQFIIRLDSGFIVALPYMVGNRQPVIQSLLDRVAQQNTQGLPVVLMGHQAVTGLDITGHDFDIGTLRTLDLESMGNGYDYLALGHIHMPQTLNHQEDAMKENVSYPAPVARYSGSALHVSCDETYPHSVSLVDIDRHQGQVTIRQLRIDQLRHFYVLPTDGPAFTTPEEALTAMKDFIQDKERGYLRFRFDYSADLPSNFNQQVYDILDPTHDEWRYNPKIIWEGEQPTIAVERPVFQVADLNQMTDPMQFIEQTIGQYPEFTLDDLRAAFGEIEQEAARLAEEKEEKDNKKTKGKNQ